MEAASPMLKCHTARLEVSHGPPGKRAVSTKPVFQTELREASLLATTYVIGQRWVWGPPRPGPGPRVLTLCPASKWQ